MFSKNLKNKGKLQVSSCRCLLCQNDPWQIFGGYLLSNCANPAMARSRSDTGIWSNRWHFPTTAKVWVSNPCAIIYIFFLLDLLGQMFTSLQQIQCDVSKISSNTDPLVELEKIASGKGFVISHNEGSGNCMFHALSEQLNIVKGSKISHGELRQSIVQYLLNNPRLVSSVQLYFSLLVKKILTDIHRYMYTVHTLYALEFLCSLNLFS